jgi:hypothetical protein
MNCSRDYSPMDELLEMTIGGLKPYTQYLVAVIPYNLAGEGEPTFINDSSTRTLEGGKGVFLNLYDFTELAYKYSIMFIPSWKKGKLRIFLNNLRSLAPVKLLFIYLFIYLFILNILTQGVHISVQLFFI